jgi:hypothetical protein
MFVCKSLVPEQRGFVMLKKVFCAAFCVLASMLPSSCAEAGQNSITNLAIYVRVSNSNVPIAVTLDATSYDGADGRSGCNDAKYDYAKVTTPPTWPVTYQGTTYTEQQHKDYWVYTGYTVDGGGDCDWTENCHGYAFVVGDWPNDSSVLKSAGSPVIHCWIQDMTDAIIADNTTHTIKITVVDCPNSIGLTITATSEKFKMSPKYKVTRSCNDGGVDLTLGNAPRGGMNNLLPYRLDS